MWWPRRDTFLRRREEKKFYTCFFQELPVALEGTGIFCQIFIRSRIARIHEDRSGHDHRNWSGPRAPAISDRHVTHPWWEQAQPFACSAHASARAAHLRDGLDDLHGYGSAENSVPSDLMCFGCACPHGIPSRWRDPVDDEVCALKVSGHDAASTSNRDLVGVRRVGFLID